jgi:hypothetical protein
MSELMSEAQNFPLALPTTVSYDDLWMVTDDMVEISTVLSKAFVVPAILGTMVPLLAGRTARYSWMFHLCGSDHSI